MASTKRSDRGYEKAAKIDPYYAVIPHAHYVRSKLTDSSLQEFFKTGEGHVESVMATIRSHFDAGFAPRRVLDYGCGVGRLLVPLARVAERAVGLDISVSMLEEAGANCDRLGIRNVELLLADDDLTSLRGKFDLIHSTIVFQHIPPKRVDKILRGLLSHLEPGGFGSLHFVFWSPPKLRAARSLMKILPLGNAIANFIKGRPLGFGYIGLYEFSMDQIAAALCDSGVRMMIANFDDGKSRGNSRSVTVTFQGRSADRKQLTSYNVDDG